ncbi:hypothetical protein ACFWPK_05135 [Nocardia sp. NPDC058519]|uniref:hypothetical protein n=1 Tax=Nocardia sp. NPDC058519 TaxID=3346535 RepID=UPI00366001EE
MRTCARDSALTSRQHTEQGWTPAVDDDRIRDVLAVRAVLDGLAAAEAHVHGLLTRLARQ